MREPRYVYQRRVVYPSGFILYSVHDKDGAEIERFEADPEAANVTIAEAGLEYASAAAILRLPRGLEKAA